MRYFSKLLKTYIYHITQSGVLIRKLPLDNLQGF